MQDPALATIAICGFSFVCLGLIAIVGFLVLRYTGRTVGDLFGEGGIRGMIDTLADEDDDPLSNVRRRRTGSSDLRAKAQSLDFDATVAKYKSQPPGASPPVARSPFPPPGAGGEEHVDLDASQRIRRKRRKREDDDDEGDEMFEHFLDEE